MKLNDSITVNCTSNLSFDELKSLSLLYQPLISQSGVATYLTLYTLTSQNESDLTLTAQQLKKILDTTVKDFQYCLKKLSSVGLISFYLSNKDDTNYLVILNKPCMADAFFSSILLKNNFFHKMGVNSVQEIAKYFAIKHYNLDNYTSLNESFEQYFDYLIPTNFEIKGHLSKEKDLKLPTVKSFFDYELFLNLLESDLINDNPNIAGNEEYINQILMLAFTYKLSEVELVNLYKELVVSNNQPSINDLVFFIKRRVEDTSNNEKSSKEELNLKLLQTMPIKDLLYVFSQAKNIPLTPLDISNANDFYLQNPNVDKGFLAISVLSAYSFKQNVPNVSYLKAVLNTYQTSCLKLEDAFEKFTNNQESKKGTSNYRKNYNNKEDKVVRNAWIDNILKKLEKKQGE